MHFRSRLPLLGAIACVLLTTGCPAVKKALPNQVAADEEISSTIAGDKALATGIKGKVVMGAKAVSGAKVFASDQRLKQIPEFGADTTDAQGEFAFKPIAANNVWFVMASVNGTTAASMVVPLQKKEIAVNVSLASSVATAGLVPLFTVAKPRPYILKYLDMTLFNALVAAVDKCIAADKLDIKLAKTLGALSEPFDKMVKSSTTSGIEVKKAYEAIVADLKKKEELRLQGKSNQIKPPQETVPPKDDAGNDTGTDDDTDADPDDTATDTDDPDTEPTFDPILGTLTEVPDVTFNSLRPLQLMSLAGQLFAPDGDRILQFDNAMKVKEKESPVAFTDARAMTLVGTKACAVGKVAGQYVLIASPIGATSEPPPINLSGQAVVRISSLAAYDASHMLAVDEANHTIVKININDGKVTLYAGKPGVMGKTTTKKPAAEFEMSGPTAIIKDGTTFYVTDTNNHRVLKITGDEIEPFAGSGQVGLTPGTLQGAKIETPTSIDYDSFGKKFYVVCSSRGAVFVIDAPNDKVVALANEATKADAGQDFVPNAQGVVYHEGAPYIISDKKLKKFTSP